MSKFESLAEEPLLGKRYRNDGKPLLALDTVQIETEKQVEQKVKDGIYKFESVPCCVCNGREFELLSNKDRYGLYMPVVICRKCGLIQTNPRMDQESYSSFYNYEYRNLYGGELPGEEFFSAQYSKGQRIYNYLQNRHVFTRPPSEMFILEVGCATGGILKYFRDTGCRVKGIDLDEGCIDFGKTKYNLDLSAGTIRDISLREPPDIIIYADAFEHVLYPKEELAQISRLLPQDGLIYIEVPGVKYLLNSWRDFLGLMQNAHTYHFTLNTLRNLVESNGFQMVTGDESIASVFKKTPAASPGKSPENDYQAVISYLKRWEILRRFFPFFPGELKSIPMSMMVSLLKTLRMYNLARKVYGSLKGIFSPKKHR